MRTASMARKQGLQTLSNAEERLLQKEQELRRVKQENNGLKDEVKALKVKFFKLLEDLKRGGTLHDYVLHRESATTSLSSRSHNTTSVASDRDPGTDENTAAIHRLQSELKRMESMYKDAAQEAHELRQNQTSLQQQLSQFKEQQQQQPASRRSSTTTSTAMTPQHQHNNNRGTAMTPTTSSLRRTSQQQQQYSTPHSYQHTQPFDLHHPVTVSIHVNTDLSGPVVSDSYNNMVAQPIRQWEPVTISDCPSTMLELQHQLRQKNAAIVELNARVQRAQIQVDTLTSTYEDLMGQLSESKQALYDAQAKQSESETELLRLRRAHDSHSEVASALRLKETEIQSLETQLSRALSRIHSVQVEVECDVRREANVRIGQLQNSLEEESIRNRSLERELQEVQGSHRLAKDEINTLRLELEARTREAKRARDDHATASRDLERLRTLCADGSQGPKVLDDDMKMALTLIERRRRQNESLDLRDIELEWGKDEVATLTQHIETQALALDAATRENQIVRSERDTLRHQVEDLQTQVGEANERCLSLQIAAEDGTVSVRDSIESGECGLSVLIRDLEIEPWLVRDAQTQVTTPASFFLMVEITSLDFGTDVTAPVLLPTNTDALLISGEPNNNKNPFLHTFLDMFRFSPLPITAALYQQMQHGSLRIELHQSVGMETHFIAVAEMPIAAIFEGGYHRKLDKTLDMFDTTQTTQQRQKLAALSIEMKLDAPLPKEWFGSGGGVCVAQRASRFLPIVQKYRDVSELAIRIVRCDGLKAVPTPTPYVFYSASSSSGCDDNNLLLQYIPDTTVHMPTTAPTLSPYFGVSNSHKFTFSVESAAWVRDGVLSFVVFDANTDGPEEYLGRGTVDMSVLLRVPPRRTIVQRVPLLPQQDSMHMPVQHHASLEVCFCWK
eukprot:PhM_4_TR459/c0_g1_i1/m.31150